MKVVLAAATPAEHAIGTPGEATRDFAFSSYNYAIGLLQACVEADPLAARRVELARCDLPLWRAHGSLSQAQLRELLSLEPDVLGLSCYCWSADALLEAAAELKRLRPHMLVVAGGPSVTFNGRDLLQRFAHLDIIVRGEAELSFVQLCRQGFERPWEVPNVTCRLSDGTIQEHSSELVVGALGTLPSAYLSGVLAPQAPTLLIEPSRGCRFRCSFCAWSTRQGPIRTAPAARIAGEIRWAIERGYQGLNFCDTAINHDTESMRALCELLAREDPEKKLSLSLFVRHEALDDEQLELLSGLRCDEVILGLESIHAAALRQCGKPPLEVARFEQRLQALERAGCKVTLSIMSGLPGDSVEGFRATLRYLEELLERFPRCVNFVCCFWLAVLPGTRFAAMAERSGFETLPRGTPYLTRSHEHPAEALADMARAIVELAERNPRFRCEEIHRDAAAGDTLGMRPRAEAPASDFVSLLLPWRPGQTRGAWLWAAHGPAIPGEGTFTVRFRHALGAGEVQVTLSGLDTGRACFARTARYNVHYRQQGELPEGAAARLVSVVVTVISANEARAG